MCGTLFIELGQLQISPYFLPHSGIHSLLPDVWCKNVLFHLSCLLWSCLRQEDKCVLYSFMSTKMEVPCNQNWLNALWMLGTDFCAWVKTWLRICGGALGRPSLAGERRQLQTAFSMRYIQFSSVAQSCVNLQLHGLQHAGLPIIYRVLELVQTLVHLVGDAIQPSHPLSSSSPPAFNLSQ